MKAGIKYKEFMHMTLTELYAELEGYSKRQTDLVEMIEYSAWLFGIYSSHAIQCTVGNSQWFHKKGAEPNKYPDNPLLKSKEEVEEDVLTEEQKMNYTNAFFGRLNILAVNHKLAKDREKSEDLNNGNEGVENNVVNIE